MRTVFFIPPLSRMSGGLANIFAMAADVAGLGYSVAVTCPGEAAGLREMLEREKTRIPLLPWDSLELTPEDVWGVPESWPNALAPGVNCGARTVVYAQSWNFLLTTLPAGVRWQQMPVTFLAVSRPVAWFMERILELRVAGVLPPAVHPLFFAPRAAELTLAGKRPVRVAWMPRKNRALAEQVQQVAEAALARSAPVQAGRVEWVPIQNMPQDEVAATMASCSLFLNTAFPEGFGLPPLEAMAVGCVPVGFTGFGGWEYMRQANGVADGRADGVANGGEKSAVGVAGAGWVDAGVSAGASAGGTPNSGADAMPGAEFRLFQQACAPCFPAAEAAAFPEIASAIPPKGGNGFYFNDGDIMGAGLGLAHAISVAHAGGVAWETLRRSARETAELYSAEARRERVRQVWARLAQA